MYKAPYAFQEENWTYNWIKRYIPEGEFEIDFPHLPSEQREFDLEITVIIVVLFSDYWSWSLH